VLLLVSHVKWRIRLYGGLAGAAGDCLSIWGHTRVRAHTHTHTHTRSKFIPGCMWKPVDNLGVPPSVYLVLLFFL
jgi:hypothetical protein